MRRRRGFSLIELMLVASIFSLFLIASYMLLSSGLNVWHKTSGSQDIDTQFSRLEAVLRRDLQDGSFAQCAVGKTPWLPPGGGQSNVLWLLSALDPGTGDFVRKQDGSPFWQRGILYYLSVPLEHDEMFGVRCDSKRFSCSHGMLIRRVVDINPMTTPTGPESKIEKLMSPAKVSGLLDRPRSFALDFTPREEVESSEIVASGLLDFQVALAPSSDYPSEVEIRLASFQVEEAGKKVRLGQEDLLNSPYTRQLLISIFPGNS